MKIVKDENQTRVFHIESEDSEIEYLRKELEKMKEAVKKMTESK